MIMIDFINKDITNETNGLILQGVNCKGVMGSGLAKAIRNKWPIVYTEYSKLTFNMSLLGTVQYVPISDKLVVANCFTQNSYGSDGKRYADLTSIRSCIENAFKYANYNDLVIKTPEIGCGLGGLSWDKEVQPIFEEIEQSYDDVKIQYIELV